MNQNRPDHNTEDSRKNYGEEVWNFVSAQALKPMKVTVNTDKPGIVPGLLFVALYTVYGTEMIGQAGSLIMDQEGNPVWLKKGYPQLIWISFSYIFIPANFCISEIN